MAPSIDGRCSSLPPRREVSRNFQTACQSARRADPQIINMVRLVSSEQHYECGVSASSIWWRYMLVALYVGGVIVFNDFSKSAPYPPAAPQGFTKVDRA